MSRKFLLLFSLLTIMTGRFCLAQSSDPSRFKGYGQNFFKADGTPRTMAVFLFNGMTAQDFVGVYGILNFASGPDLKVVFVAKKKGLIHDERGRLQVMADYSIDDIKSADIFIVPGGLHFDVVKDKKQLAWVKKMYDVSEYTASICTGAVILAASGATTGKHAGTAWAARDFLAPLGVTYVATPPPSIEGKYFSAAGAAAGIEIALKLMEKITGSKTLSQTAELAAEWNPSMLYGSGDPQKASPEVIANFGLWMRTDPAFKP